MFTSLKTNESLHIGKKSSVYRTTLNDKKVIVKVLEVENPSQKEISKLQNEFEIARELDYKGIVKPISVEKENSKYALVLEDTGGTSLNHLIRDSVNSNPKKLELHQKLNIAIKVCESLEVIHSKEIIHLDIKPHNIIVNLDLELVQITDFGISTRLTRENPTINSPENMEGTLAYISPEQTGRMNRSIDYRTDFYSLGVTFYELFTGKLPFTSKDAMELIHCHIAVKPESPSKFEKDIPKVLSEIIIKLMAKNAEDRYLSAYGIRRDLEKCYELNLKGELEKSNFELAEYDKSAKFQIPQKLYGREGEIKQLLESFYTVSEGSSRLMIVKGFSGIGKSVLVNEVHKPIVEKRGYFISGKFDQFKRDIPYSAIIQSFQELIRQLLTESEEHIKGWKESILRALGNNGQVIIDVIPEVEFIIGKQPPVPELGPTESQNRFNLVFKEFVKVFTSAEHPLVLFIDDMQWADSASLKFTENILTDSDIRHLLYISSYRDNEVDGTHSLVSTIDTIKKSECKIETISLLPLKEKDIDTLLTETLSLNESKVNSLTKIILEKTNGNPFFVNEFLKSLYNENLLNYDIKTHEWEWNIEKVKNSGITDNLVELMSGKIKKLSAISQKLIQLASCVGSSFDLSSLALVYEKNPMETYTDLSELLREGFILSIGEAHKYIGEETNSETIRFKFLHDRVQQAAYALIGDEEKKKTHLFVGKHILASTNESDLEDKIFDIVNHLNVGGELISEREDIINYIRLNLLAGKKAKMSAAYEPSVKFLKRAIEKLNTNSWQSDYTLTLEVYTELADSLTLNSDYVNSETTIEVIKKNAKEVLDKVRAYEIQIRTLNAQNFLIPSLDVAREILAQLGVKLPKKPGFVTHVGPALIKTKIMILIRGWKYLRTAQAMSDPKKIAAMRILNNIGSTAYQSSFNLFSILLFTMTYLSYRYGNSYYTPYGIALYAVANSGVLQDFPQALRFGKLSLELLELLNTKQIHCRTHMVSYSFVTHWTSAMKETYKPFEEAAEVGLEIGDIEYSGYCLFFNSLNGLFSDRDILKIKTEFNHSHSKFRGYNQAQVLNVIKIWFQFVEKISKESVTDFNLNGDYFEENKNLSFLYETNYKPGIGYAHHAKAILAFHFENYEYALEQCKLAMKCEEGLMAMSVMPHLYMLESLARIRVFKYSGKKAILAKVYFNLLRLKWWAKFAPMNHLHRYEIVRAELYAALGKKDKAEKYYLNARGNSHENKFLWDEALICELFGEFLLAKKDELSARIYLMSARDNYSKWGGVAKVKQLEKKYPDLVISFMKLAGRVEMMETDPTGTVSVTISSDPSKTRVSTTKRLDVGSIFKASQTLSGEIQLEKLLSKMMKFLLENAGAENGCLVLATEKGELYIEASGKVSENTVNVLQSIPIKEYLYASTSVIQFVSRTKTNVVISDAKSEGNFVNDVYIKGNQVSSLLCAPILNQGKLVGIIYLENNLTTGAFTKDRIEVLQILASQAAISIDNAKLYTNLEHRVRERTKEIGDILSNVEQGILTINRDFSINPDYSRKVLEIFGVKELSVKDFRVLVSEEKRNKVQNFIVLLFENPFMSAKMFEKSNPLKEYTYSTDKGTKQLSFSFSRIFKLDNEGNKTDEIEKIMVVIDDKTAEYELQKRLEEKTKEQASKVEKMYQILGMDAKIFSGFIKEANETIESIKPKLVGMVTGVANETSASVIEPNRKIIEETFRAVHSLKGNARALNLESIGERAHKLEDELDKLRNNVAGIEKEFIERTLSALEEFHAEIKDGSSIFEKILGMKSALGDSKATPDNPVKELEDFLRTIVKKESAGLGKEIDFEFSREGEDISAELLAKLKNPLIQIVKNSIDHGIEKTEVRVQSGKSAKGKISVKIIQPVASYPLAESQWITQVICEDDGGGLNLERIKRKAIEVGLVSGDILSKMPMEDIYQLIFHPGFSTADKVTGISGRGVGMDIVRDEIEKLGGKIRIETEQGKFTRFSIVVGKYVLR